MRLASDAITIQEFWNDLRDTLNREESYYSVSNYTNSDTDILTLNFYKRYEQDRKMVDDILRVDRERLLQSSDAQWTIDQINVVLNTMREKVSHIRYGALNPILLNPLPLCSSCDRSFDVLVQLDTDCVDCRAVYLCEECIKESVALLYQHLSESIGE